jgi:hypothetical protein
MYNKTSIKRNILTIKQNTVRRAKDLSPPQKHPRYPTKCYNILLRFVGGCTGSGAMDIESILFLKP